MKKLTTLATVLTILVIANTLLFAQSVGDYRSAATGNWSAAASWETWNGSGWVPAGSPPTGSEYITVDDAVTLDVAVAISGYVKVEGAGEVINGAGSITFNNGSTYEHALNGGNIPTSTWGTGSTCLITGAVGNSPGNANQNFYNFTWNCAAQSSNLNLAWTGITIGGDVTCLNSGSSRFQFSNNTAYVDSITIMGNIIVQSGTLTSNGSSGAQNYLIIVEGNIIVTGGNFSLSRGSGGVATWRLYGDLNVSNATLQTSNTSCKFVFADVAVADTQDIAMSGVTYTSSWDYEINSGALVRIVDGPDQYDLVVKKDFINGGDLISNGVVQFQNGANYQHTVNSGSIPVGVWETGSTATFTGITSQAPANRNQSFYNIVWNCPDQTSNLNMGFDEVTIGGDINIVSTGASSRWYLCSPPGGDSATITINGNIIQTGGQFSSNGSGNAAFIEITVNGDISVTNGNFSVSRGSQGGTGTTKWYLHGTNFSMTDATTQNSNAAGAKFVFSGTTQQNLTLTNVTFSGGFPVEVAPNAILDVGTSEIEGSGDFTLNDGGTLQTANIAGLDSTLKNSGTITLGTGANYTFNGSDPQVTGSLLPSTINNLTINNAMGVALTVGVTVNGTLTVNDGDLDLNGNDVVLGTTATLAETPGNTVIGSPGMITTTRDLNAPSGNNVGGMGAMLTTSANLGSTTIERTHTAGTGGGNAGIFRVFNIQPTNNSGLDATLRFYYDESELNGISESNLRLFKSPGGANNTWSFQGGTVDETNNYVELSAIGSFSYWTLADINNPIPVELTSFTATSDNNNVLLKWTTASEKNNSGWNVERRIKNNDNTFNTWKSLGFVDGSGTSTDNNNYSFTDKDIVSAQYQYRLQQVDYDGTTTYSDIVEIVVDFLPTDFALYQNYPNPFNPATTIKFDVPKSSFVNITVYNSIGEKVETIINEQLEQGVYKVQFDASKLPSGFYIYRFTSANNVFTKKMMLIK